MRDQTLKDWVLFEMQKSMLLKSQVTLFIMVSAAGKGLLYLVSHVINNVWAEVVAYTTIDVPTFRFSLTLHCEGVASEENLSEFLPHCSS
jgi:hypothetical protein